jgi:hypothetical protein
MDYKELVKQKDEKYLLALDTLDPTRVGVVITCPKCQSISWTKFPDKRYCELPIQISCPTSCGTYLFIEEFSPRAHPLQADEYDYHSNCHYRN